MRVGHLQQTRPQYYDRILVNQTVTYDASGIAPHGLTERWSYTVPTGRLAFADSAFVELLRTTVATVAGNNLANIGYTPSGGTRAVLLIVATRDISASRDDIHDNAVLGFLSAGDILSGETRDSMTGGAVSYTVSAKIAEFAR